MTLTYTSSNCILPAHGYMAKVTRLIIKSLVGARLCLLMHLLRTIIYFSVSGCFFAQYLIKTILCVPFQTINIVPSIVTPSGPKDRY